MGPFPSLISRLINQLTEMVRVWRQSFHTNCAHCGKKNFETARLSCYVLLDILAAGILRNISHQQLGQPEILSRKSAPQC